MDYKGADGALIPNEGEITIKHIEPDGEFYEFIMQNAKVHCPIISARYLVTRDCLVVFHKNGGYILYSPGKRNNFVLKEGVFFVRLNVLPPDLTPDKAKPGFARPGP